MTASFSPESLLAYEPFVYAVARGLLNSEAETEDVVQETWLRALRQDSGAMAEPKSWLARVVRNLVKDRFRGESRRHAREEAVARPEEIVADSASQLEGHRAVVDAVLALEEPYKGVVLLRYYEGLTPAAIAETLNREPATVRSQLHRAHATLRASMDAEFGGDRRAWAALLLPEGGGGFGGAAQQTAAHGTGASGGAVAAALPAGVKVAAFAAVCLAALIGLPPVFEHVFLVEDGAQAGGAGVSLTQAGGASPASALAPSNAPGEAQRNMRIPALPGAGPLEIVVVQDGAAVPGASVWFLRQSDVDPNLLVEEPWLNTDISMFMGRFGTHYTADEVGRVHIAWAGDEGLAYAHSPGFHGSSSTEEVVGQRLSVVLAKTSHVQVVVRDSNGGPVPGIRVALRLSGPDDPSGRLGGNVQMVAYTAESDAQGLVSFRDFVGRMKGSIPGETRYDVLLLIPGVDVAVAFDPDEERREPTVLRAPATCALRVRALDRSGKRVDMGAYVTISGLRRATVNALSAKLVEGEAHFNKLAPGVQVEVVIESLEQGLVWRAKGITAAAAGELTTIDVVDPGRPTLTGHALDEKGTPLAGARVWVLLRSESRVELQRIQVKTDDAGRYRVQLDEKVPGGSVVLASLLTWGATGALDRMGGWRTRADYGAPFEVRENENDLGDLTLRDAHPLVRGRCLDLRGEVVEGLELSLLNDMDRTFSSVVTDADGRFEVSGLWPERIELSTRHDSPWVVVEPRALTRGAGETPVRVARGGTIAGSVKLDDDLRGGTLSFVVYPDGVEMKGIAWKSITVIDASDGSFESTGMEAGLYHCLLMRNSTTLLEVRDVHVQVEQTTRPLELQNCTPGVSLESIEFSVVTQDGGALNAWAGVYDGGKLVGYQNSVRGAGVVKLSYPGGGAPTVVVSQTGYRTGSFGPRQAPKTVRLKRAIRVLLMAQGGLELKRGDVTARLSLKLETSAEGEPAQNFGPGYSASIPAALAKRGSAQVSFPAPGIYRLHVALHNDLGNGMVSAGEGRPLDVTLEVHDYDDDGELRIKLPRDVFGDG